MSREHRIPIRKIWCMTEVRLCTLVSPIVRNTRKLFTRQQDCYGGSAAGLTAYMQRAAV